MKTNTTVYLSLEVWDSDSGILNKNDEMRDIDNLVIPFNETTASNVWKIKRFTLSDGAYLEMQFQIETCNGNFSGLGCSFCADHIIGENCDTCQKEWSGEKCEECAENYFPEKVCNLTCTAEEGRYTCSDSGTKVCNENWKGAECDNCAEHRTGETCEECSEGWGGIKCQECAQDYYPEIICYVKCSAVEGRYRCSDSGKKVCNENWVGVECHNCAEHRTGETCEECSEGWGGIKCQECAQDYYPESICNVKCTAEEGRYRCSDSGKKVCNENWVGVECDNCAEHRTGETCEECSEGWGGIKCQECAQDYYPESICNVKCSAVEGRYRCSDSGKKVCNENWVGVECDNCAEHRTGETCDECSEGWGGSKCQECAQDYYPEIICNVKCTAEGGRYTCSDSGKKVCNENWKGAECDSCADHRTGITCEQCSKGWRGNNCQKCAQDYYPEGLCNVTCTEEKNKFTCKEDGLKACSKNWRGEECDNCSGGYFGEFCVVFCEDTESYNCSSTGEIVCLDETSTAENNCRTLSKLSKKSKISIGAVTGTTFLAVILLVGIVLMRRRNKKLHTSQLVGKTDEKQAEPKKKTEASKSGQSSIDLTSSSKELTYATLNHKSYEWKSTENEESFQNIAFIEADLTYITLNRELEHSINDSYEQSNYADLCVEKMRQTHIKKGEENVNQGVPQTEDFKEENTYSDISLVFKNFCPNIESEKKVEQLANQTFDPPSKNYEDAYSHLTKSNTSIKDCCKGELEEEETYADITILGPREEDEAVNDNEEECVYADVSFLGKRKEFEMQEHIVNEKEGSAIYFTMRDTIEEHSG